MSIKKNNVRSANNLDAWSASGGWRQEASVHNNQQSQEASVHYNQQSQEAKVPRSHHVKVEPSQQSQEASVHPQQYPRGFTMHSNKPPPNLSGK